ncbi:MAG: patatin-like phospholipase family protein [Bdellovibrionaceae bacterium]|nr:patatin-like phospholipase family protein [Pseudobdellovibrionaceae bacterium]
MTPVPHARKHALVLTGGGARAAYQVGALKAIAELMKFDGCPFQIISGYSAGAINGVWLASRCESFAEATQGMWDQWANLKTEKIFKTDAPNFFMIGLRWLKDRSLGGATGEKQITYLLNTEPLRKFINEQINFNNIKRHIEAGTLQGLSVTAANYNSGYSTTFFSTPDGVQEWSNFNRVGVRTDITAEHVMASAAIPIFFPPVQLNGAFYGDGMVRLGSPLSSAIRMGADKMLVIGVRGVSAHPELPSQQHFKTVSISEIAGTILNGLFLDSLESDLQRMERVNRTLSLMTEDELGRQKDHLRAIPVLSLRPSKEVSNLSACESESLPSTLRFLLRGIGMRDGKGSDLLSYLSFEPEYMQSLLRLGFEDTMAREQEIRDFFKD